MAYAPKNSVVVRLPSPDLCVTFANTAIEPAPAPRQPRPVRLPAFESYGDLVAWCRGQDALRDDMAESLVRAAAERPEQAAAVVAGSLRLRTLLIELLGVMANGKTLSADHVERFNALLAEFPRTLRLGTDGRTVSLGSDSLLDTVFGLIGNSMISLLNGKRWVRRCAGNHCGRFVVQGSHGQRRLWCNKDSCGRR